jgi:hypothetical protein
MYGPRESGNRAAGGCQLGIADRTDIEFFSGGHVIQGRGTFAFLHKHLNWPAAK